MDTNTAATSAPETTAPAAAPETAPAATPAPSAADKADASNTAGRNRFDRPTPRQALEQAVAKQKEKQSAAPAAKPGATHYATKPAQAAPAAAPGSAPQASAVPPAAKASPPPTVAPTQGQQVAAPKTLPADRPRDADGKFKKLPRGWKSQLAPAFEALPPEVQEEAHRREDAAYEGLTQYKEGAARYQEIEKAITPYMATIRQMGATPAQAIQYLFNIDHTLRYGTAIDKQRTLAQVAQTFGVDLGQLSQVPQESQDVVALRQQLASTTQQVQQLQQAQGQAQLAPYNAQIEQFKAAEGHEHFAELEPAMTGLIGSGAAKNLAEAYDMALWARPDLRESQIAAQRQAWEQEQQARVNAAKSAAVQVRGAPAPAALPQTIDPKNRRDVILSAYRNLQQT